MENHFEASPEVEAKIQKLFSELHDLCAPHNLPMVLAVGLRGNDNGIVLALSARLSSETNSAPNAMIAAVEIMKIGDVPDYVVEALIERNSDQKECNCPTCQAARASLQGAKIVTH